MYWRHKSEAVEKLRRRGIIPLDHYAIRQHEQLDNIIRLCAPLIRPYVRSNHLIFIFPYDRTAQPAPFAGCAGLQTGNHRTAVIGIAAEVLQGKWGQDYAVYVMLHEIAHMEYDGHGPEFISHLDGLIARFNRATGRNIKNDKRHVHTGV